MRFCESTAREIARNSEIPKDASRFLHFTFPTNAFRGDHGGWIEWVQWVWIRGLYRSEQVLPVQSLSTFASHVLTYQQSRQWD